MNHSQCFCKRKIASSPIIHVTVSINVKTQTIGCSVLFKTKGQFFGRKMRENMRTLIFMVYNYTFVHLTIDDIKMNSKVS